MIFVGDDENSSQAPQKAHRETSARDLLATCVKEMSRQAAAIADLDAALGDVLMALRHAPGANPALSGRDITALQGADRIRQEIEGIARALELILKAGSLNAGIEGRHVRSCTPVAALQDRLMG